MVLSSSPEPHSSRAGLGAAAAWNRGWADHEQCPCAAPHTHLHFPFHGQGVKGTLLPQKVLFAVLERGIPWALLPLCPVLSMECLSRENMGHSVYIFDFHVEAPKLGQWPDNSSFLPASHEAVASLYPSWQRRWNGEENCPKNSKVSL